MVSTFGLSKGFSGAKLSKLGVRGVVRKQNGRHLTYYPETAKELLRAELARFGVAVGA
jgi:hypothetical protein